MPAADLILASASPRRRELLDQIGVCYRVQVADVDETLLPGEAPAAYVTRLALAKARAVAALPAAGGLPVLGADTTVVIDGDVLVHVNDEVRASLIGLPASMLSARASDSRSRSIRSATRERIRPRSPAGTRDHSGSTPRAASTARSTSRSSESGSRAYASPVAGSTSSSHAPHEGASKRPAMKFRTWCIGAV